MLKVVEKVCETPIRLMSMPGVKLVPGYIGTLKEYNGTVVCDLCSPDDVPFGVIGSRRFNKTGSLCFEEKEMVNIWHQRMIFRTDRFEKNIYKPGDKLYVNESGLITNEPINDDSSWIARVTGCPEDLNGYIEALWL